MTETGNFTNKEISIVNYLVSCTLEKKYISSVHIMAQYEINRGQFEKCVNEAKKILQKIIIENELNNKKNLDTNIVGR